MNWINNYVRPKIRSLVGVKSDVPENLWVQCTSCEQMLFHRDLEDNLKVCPNCGNHMRLGARKRLELLFDGGSFTEIELPGNVTDPLKFRDRKRYSERLRDTRTATGRTDAIIVAYGEIAGHTTVVSVFDFSFMGGSMGIAVGNGIVAGAQLAVSKKAAFVVVPSSGGARMQEGILSLMQMPRTTIAVQQVKEASLPYIVVLADPTTGGVSASFAMLGDIALAEPGTIIGFAGARVIKETIREKLPEGFQRSEYLLDHGMIDMVVPRHELATTLGRILDLLRRKVPSADDMLINRDGESSAGDGNDRLFSTTD
ncbi:MAG: acetyl-CoA carboxylase carboxyl transferase subunit beta [Pelagibacteraceae bacterium]|nr:acetyl-CoA carboxylase carboxyl transferase subunit beta [Pelagibacteraceae bacterium]PPR10856.1 MAG: Acetyl-coenzyme A carboxylase carboxyl transferase subunit beta [Alphaproteobacteria bacterium MarineAlpha11_Bin1]